MGRHANRPKFLQEAINFARFDVGAAAAYPESLLLEADFGIVRKCNHNPSDPKFLSQESVYLTKVYILGETSVENTIRRKQPI